MNDASINIPTPDKLTQSTPFRETEQYTQLAIIDALRRAVQEGKQYFGWAQPDVHAQRWGTESIQFAPMEDNPRVMRGRYGSPGSSEMEGNETLMQALQRRSEGLLDEDDPHNMTMERFDLDDPEVLQ